MNLKTGDVLLSMVVKVSENFVPSDVITVGLGNNSEITGSDAIPITGETTLFFPKIVYKSAIGINDGNELISQCMVYPNPGNEDLFVDYTLHQAGKVTFQITNMLGQPVTLLQSTQDVGKQHVKLDVSRFQPGAYGLVISYSGKDGETTIRKTVVLK